MRFLFTFEKILTIIHEFVKNLENFPWNFQNSSKFSVKCPQILKIFCHIAHFQKISGNLGSSDTLLFPTLSGFRNHHFFLNSCRVSSYFWRVLDTFKHDGFLLNFEHYLIVIKGTYKNMIMPPVRNLHILLNPNSFIILQKASWHSVNNFFLVWVLLFRSPLCTLDFQRFWPIPPNHRSIRGEVFTWAFESAALQTTTDD